MASDFPKKPVFYWKYLRLGDSRLEAETYRLPFLKPEAKSSGENKKISIFESGVNGSYVVDFTSAFYRTQWDSTETHAEFAARLRDFYKAFIDVANTKFDLLRGRLGHLSMTPNESTNRATSSTSVTGSGSEAVTIDTPIADLVTSDWLLIIHTNGTTHAVVQATSVASTSNFTAAFGTAFPAGSTVIRLEWYLPFCYPIQDITLQRDDLAPNAIVRAQFSFQGADDPVDNVTIKGAP